MYYKIYIYIYIYAAAAEDDGELTSVQQKDTTTIIIYI